MWLNQCAMCILSGDEWASSWIIQLLLLYFLFSKYSYAFYSCVARISCERLATLYDLRAYLVYFSWPTLMHKHWKWQRNKRISRRKRKRRRRWRKGIHFYALSTCTFFFLPLQLTDSFSYLLKFRFLFLQNKTVSLSLSLFILFFILFFTFSHVKTKSLCVSVCMYIKSMYILDEPSSSWLACLKK